MHLVVCLTTKKIEKAQVWQIGGFYTGPHGVTCYRLLEAYLGFIDDLKRKTESGHR
jgi:hypothetical protein